MRVAATNVSITAYMARYPGDWEPKNITKSYHIRNLTQEIYWEDNNTGG